MNQYPLLSIILPTYNEEDIIERCLSSIFMQDYPHEKLEVIIIDNSSTDKTLEIAKKFPVKILHNKKIKDAEVSKRIGFEHSKGSLYMWIDADMEIASSGWIIKMVEPLLEDVSIVGSLSCFKIKGDETPLTKFLTLDANQRDPIYQFFSPSIFQTIRENKNGYSICIFKKGMIPTHGFGIFKKDAVEKTIHLQGNKLMELDILAHLVNQGFNRFAFIPDGIYHYLMPDLRTLLWKRIRNIKRVYLGQAFKRSYTWFDLKNPKDIIKIFIWILYVNLFLPELIRGIYKSIHYRTWVGMYQPFVSLLETDIIIFALIYYFAYYRLR